MSFFLNIMRGNLLIPIFITYYTIMISSLNYNLILLSRFSHLDGSHFRLLIDQMKPKDKKTLVYVPTASYFYKEESTKSRGEQRRRARYDAKSKMDILKEALDIENSILLELDDPKMNPDNINSALSNAGIVYVDGGNTFYLQKFMHKTKFWDLIDTNLRSGMLYMGCSAGAIVAGKSISTAYWKGWDSPEVQDITWDETTLKGRGLVDFDIFPHYDNSIHKDLVAEKSLNYPNKVINIPDNMALINSIKENTIRNFEFYSDGSLANILIKNV